MADERDEPPTEPPPAVDVAGRQISIGRVETHGYEVGVRIREEAQDVSIGSATMHRLQEVARERPWLTVLTVIGTLATVAGAVFGALAIF